MTKDEALAMDLALEALKKNHYYMIDAGLPNQSMLNKNFEAITAIKQVRALDRKAENARELGLDYEPVAIPDCGEAGHADGACGNRECLPSFRRNTTLPAAPVQEPVYVKTFHGGKPWPLHPAPVQPVAWFWFDDMEDEWKHLADNQADADKYLPHKVVPLYTTPPAAQRTWVDLTDEEIWDTISRIGTSDSDVNPYAKLSDARAIEAKLREKNT